MVTSFFLHGTLYYVVCINIRTLYTYDDHVELYQNASTYITSSWSCSNIILTLKCTKDHNKIWFVLNNRI